MSNTDPYKNLPEPMQLYLAQVEEVNGRLDHSVVDRTAWGHAAMDACQAEWQVMEEALPEHLRGLLLLHFKPLVLSKLQIRLIDIAFDLRALEEAISLANTAASLGVAFNPSRATSPHIH